MIVTVSPIELEAAITQLLINVPTQFGVFWPHICKLATLYSETIIGSQGHKIVFQSINDEREITPLSVIESWGVDRWSVRYWCDSRYSEARGFSHHEFDDVSTDRAQQLLQSFIQWRSEEVE